MNESLSLPTLAPESVVNDRYEIERMLDHTYMSKVYKAQDCKMKPSDVVLKFILHPRADKAQEEMDSARQIQLQLPAHCIARWFRDEEVYVWQDRLISEAEATQKQGAYLIPFQVMEYLEGQDLEKWVHAGSISVNDAIQSMLDILEILAELHNLKWVHRDIKPSNFIRCTNGKVKIIDFGVSKRLEDLGHTVVLSPGYTPPEALRHNPVWNYFSDVYSTAAVFMTLLCGKYESYENCETVDLAVARSKVGSAITELICQDLNTDPKKRHQTGVEMHQAFQERIAAFREWQKQTAKRETLTNNAHTLKQQLKAATDKDIQSIDVLKLLAEADQLCQMLDNEIRLMEQEYRDTNLPAEIKQEVDRQHPPLKGAFSALAETVQMVKQHAEEMELRNSETTGMADAETVTPQQQVNDLAAYIRKSLKDLPRPDLDDTEALRRAIGEREDLADKLRQTLERIEGLGWSGLSLEARQDLQTEFDTFTRKLRNLAYLHQTKQEVEELWTSGEKFANTAGMTSVAYFQDALTQVSTTLKSAQHEWDTRETRLLSRLGEEAEIKYDEIRRRHEIPTTKLEGQVVEVILEFVKRAEKNPEEKVTYFNGVGVDAKAAPMTVSEALEMARERLLDFWNNKAGEYLEQARQKLRDHLPREAETILGKTDILLGRGDERMERRFPPPLEVAINNLRQEIDKELKQLNLAEQNITNARGAEARDDVLKRYYFYQEAQKVYPYIEAELKKLHDEIVQQTGEELKKLLDEAESSLKSEAWTIAQSRLGQAQKLLDNIVDSQLQASYQDRYEELQAVFTSVKEWTLPPAQQLQGARARQSLEQLEQHYRDSYWPCWPKLQARLHELQARGSVEEWLKQVDAACEKSAVVTWDLEALQLEGQEFRQSSPVGLTQQDRQRLEEAIKRLQAWLGFAQARDELQKVKQAQFDEQNGINDLSLPDLEIVENGIKEAKAYGKDKELTKQIKEQKLETDLQNIRANDTATVQTIREVQQLLTRLAPPQLEEWRQTYKVINDGLKKGTSHVQALWKHREAVRVRYAVHLYNEVKQQLETARVDYYATLGIAEQGRLRSLITEYNQLIGSQPLPDLPDKLDDYTAVALEMAVAHQYEADTHKGMLDNWDNIITAWEKARDLPQTQADGRLRDYCHQRARQAYKEKQWRDVTRLAPTDRETGESMLRLLTEDRTLSNDWEVWLKYAEYALETVRLQLTTGQPETEQPGTIKTYLDRARRSFNRAQSEGQGKSMTDDRLVRYQAISTRLQELNEWETVITAQESVTALFQMSALTNHLCAEAVEKYNDVYTQLTLLDPKKSLSSFWGRQLVAARGRLEELEKGAETVFGRLNALLALLTLFPKDQDIERRLELVVQDDALNKIQQATKDIVFDDPAVRFLDRYQRAHNGRSPENKDIVKLQLDEIGTIFRELNDLKASLKLKQLAKLKIDEAILSGEEKELEDWRDQLQELQRGLNIASRLAQAGMRDPRQFSLAFYALRYAKTFPDAFNALFNLSGSMSDKGIARVPQNFVNNKHPSYEWHKEEIEKSYQKWEEQLNFKAQIEAMFVQEQEIVGLIRQYKEGKALSNDEVKKVQELPKLLADIRRKLVEMRENAPTDPTRLQSELKYQAIDEDGNHYVSLTDIEKVVARKLEEYETLTRWLKQYHIGQTSLSGVRYRIVNWAEEKIKLAQERDKDRRNFKSVKEQCQQLLEGDAQGMYQTKLWALKTGQQALTEAAMMEYLDKQTNKRSVTGSNELTLYAVSELVNWQRQGNEKALSEAIKECEQFIANIQWRIQQINARWQTFLGAQQTLMGTKHRPFSRTRWENTVEYDAYIKAAQAFCAICPNDASFRQAIEEVYQKTGLRFQCVTPVS